MAHYAKIKDGVVTKVIVAQKDFVDTQEGTWVKTSYNTLGGIHTKGGAPLRKNYAGIGMVYDDIRDAFYAPQPYASWVLNETTCLWEPPVPAPADQGVEALYEWDESTLSWTKTQIITTEE
tara:strand:- start:269 stop:631 length:363 start_codon:yes stop_codon:yes gene_type:complete